MIHRDRSASADAYEKQGRGKPMKDTIDLLEAIGSDASLRHASPEEMQARLERAGASESLKAAASSGDAGRLAMEFGQKPMYAPQTTQTFPQGEEEEGEPLPMPSPDPSEPLPQS